MHQNKCYKLKIYIYIIYNTDQKFGVGKDS